MRRFPTLLFALFAVFAVSVTACSSDDTVTTDATTTTTIAGLVVDDADPDDATANGAGSTFTVEVWADNWMSVYVDGELIGEDSVSIRTERSFNAETFTFEASYPFTVGIEAKDFMETDSGIEYIGLNNQQMGDGGLIAQITDNSTGEVVAVTNADWANLVVQRAPLNTECEKDADPDATCQFEESDIPADWAVADHDDSSWDAATEWTANDVGPKDGYDEISWDSSAKLIWGSDLEVDNIILFRLTVAG